MFFLHRVYPAPQNFLTHALDSVAYMNASAAFDPAFADAFRNKFKEKFACEPGTAGTNSYWLPYCYVRQCAPTLWKGIADLETLYIFSMNLSTAFYLGYLVGFVILIARLGSGWESGAHLRLAAVPLILFGLSLIMFSRYYHLFGVSLSRTVFRAFLVAVPEREK